MSNSLCTKPECPAYSKCTAGYRGSRCAAIRDSYGLGDPYSKADCIRSMSDEELAEWISSQIVDRNIGLTAEAWLERLKREASS